MSERRIVNRSMSYGIEGEHLLLIELYQHGPYVVILHVMSDFSKYRQGIYSAGYMVAHKGLHAVVVVGYGEGLNEDGVAVPYWRARNSWNETWGESGFFRIIRGRNECGIEVFGQSIPVLLKNELPYGPRLGSANTGTDNRDDGRAEDPTEVNTRARADEEARLAYMREKVLMEIELSERWKQRQSGERWNGNGEPHWQCPAHKWDGVTWR